MDRYESEHTARAELDERTQAGDRRAMVYAVIALAEQVSTVGEALYRIADVYERRYRDEVDR